MALGVLNNLSAIYAENYLNNTSNSLQTVLQQLSSGSRINSGADDAAGLSLVNGLAANSAALTQSATNATEGAGLLKVADGAFSQVTNLLNRAVTLATEAANGTLNTSQEAAANQEYQSILSEINNIGSTTTYNQNQVFTGSLRGVDIYTGDSSSKGASVDSLYFAKLSSSSLGDTGGTVTQNSNGMFVDLSKDTVAGTLTTAGRGRYGWRSDHVYDHECRWHAEHSHDNLNRCGLADRRNQRGQHSRSDGQSDDCKRSWRFKHDDRGRGYGHPTYEYESKCDNRYRCDAACGLNKRRNYGNGCKHCRDHDDQLQIRSGRRQVNELEPDGSDEPD